MSRSCGTESRISGDRFIHAFSTETGLATAGSWPVSVARVDEVEGRVIDDSACEGVETPGHSFIDLRGLSKSERRKARTELAAYVTARGPSYT